MARTRSHYLALVLALGACSGGKPEKTTQLSQAEDSRARPVGAAAAGGAPSGQSQSDVEGEAQSATALPGTNGTNGKVSKADQPATTGKAITRPTKVVFTAEDGLEVSADLYLAYADERAPFIVLFHQAGWSRGEYLEIAPRLNTLGFNCLAIDQRSGKEVNGVVNETAARATASKLGTSYLDALPDLRAGLRFARAKHAKGTLLAWGSSYSAALVLWLAGEEPQLMDGVLAFAPGEYFGRFGKPKNFVAAAAAKIRMPVFVTSAQEEVDQWSAIFAAIPSPAKAKYVPVTVGNHGSRALWAKFSDNGGYWEAVTAFLAARR